MIIFFSEKIINVRFNYTVLAYASRPEIALPIILLSSSLLFFDICSFLLTRATTYKVEYIYNIVKYRFEYVQ